MSVASPISEVRATSLPTLVQMVAGGLGVTLLPEAAAAALVSPRGAIELASFAELLRGEADAYLAIASQHEVEWNKYK